MSSEEHTPQAAEAASSPRTTDRPPERLVRHCFWKYPLLSVVLLVVVALLAFFVGSPNWPRDTIAQVAQKDPGGAVLAFTQELNGTSSSADNAQEFGMDAPGQVFVLGPLRQAASLLGIDVQNAVATYNAASPQQRQDWAAAYEKALGSITAQGGGDMGGIPSPDYQKIGQLKGDFGPIPVLVQANLRLAQNGYLEQYLQAADPGHAFHLTNIWLYDHPAMLNTAVDQGLTDDQWGMVKERGFPVGPWYLIIPSVFHVYFPGGVTGPGFILWNLLFAAILLFLVPFAPGVRDLPRYLKFYRFIYRYPVAHELERPEHVERHGAVHGGVEGAGGGQ